MTELDMWLAPLALFLVWWLAGRPGWPKRRLPVTREAGRGVDSAVEPADEATAAAPAQASDHASADRSAASTTRPPADAASRPGPRMPSERLPEAPTDGQTAAAGRDAPGPGASPADADAAEQAARAAEAALREARESARRELAERERLAREAAAREREERERAEARRVEAELAARAEAERIAEAAQHRAAEIERSRREAERAAAAERARQAALAAQAARLEAEEALRRERAELVERRARVEAEAAAERERRDALARAPALPPVPAPAASDAAPAAPGTGVAPPRLASQTLVMVADDSKVVRVKTSRLLAAHQYRVLLAEDGERALALLAQEPPQVLITDVEMPGLDGLQLTRALRADPRTAALPVIMITSSDERLRDEAAASGVTVLLGKPFADDDLIGHVARLAGVQLAA